MQYLFRDLSVFERLQEEIKNGRSNFEELVKQEAVPLQELPKQESEAVPLQELKQDPETNLEGGNDPRNEMLKIFESICTKHGGPSQYLLSQYSSSEAEKLQTTRPSN